MRRFGLTALFIALFAGCGAPQQSVVPPDAGAQNDSIRQTSRGVSWMARGLKQRDLLYVANLNGTVSVYRYWQHTLVGVLTDFTQPYGECADAAGNVYIADYFGEKVDEYAHGGKKPIRVLEDSLDNPNGCAVNPKTGDLAVANYGYDHGGTIAIYPHGSGTPILYEGTRGDHFVGCAYDDRGDLLAVGDYGEFYNSAFYYLPKRGTQLVPMDLPGPSRDWEWGGVQGVAFDGTYWAVDAYDLYRYSINIKATYVDTIKLAGGYGQLGPISIYRKTPKALGSQVVGTTTGVSKYSVEFWSYPDGGSPTGEITKDLGGPSGVAISLGTR